MLENDSMETYRWLEQLSKKKSRLKEDTYVNKILFTEPDGTAHGDFHGYWKLHDFFCGVNLDQSKALTSWTHSSRVHHWMRALQMGHPIVGTSAGTHLEGSSSSQMKRVGHTLSRLLPLSVDSLNLWDKDVARNLEDRILSSTDDKSSDSNLEEARLIAGEARDQRANIYQWVESLEAELLFIVGIGGSSLGPKALVKALERHHSYIKESREIVFIDTLDPLVLSKAVQLSKGKSVACAVISKSGSTFEIEQITTSLFKEVSFVKKCSITTKQSALDDKSIFDEVFYFDKSVGGRFSVSSSVGALPISFLYGSDIFERFLSGARWSDQEALIDEDGKNRPLQMALWRLWHCVYQGISSVAVCPYINELECFISHLQQVEMESNGKSVNRLNQYIASDFSRSGPLIWGAVGPQCQHSFFQWIHQSTEKSMLEFIIEYHSDNKGDRDLAELAIAQSIALAAGKKSDNPNKNFDGKRPSLLLSTKKLEAESIGALFALYEHITVFEGFLLGLNSFDQEGVELGKNIAKGIHSRLSSHRGGLDLDEWISREIQAMSSED